MVASACAGRGEIIPTPSPAPEPTTTAPDLLAAPAPAPEPIVEVTTTEPTTVVTHPRKQTSTTTAEAAYATAPANTSSGACGGSLPPCYVLARESGGSLTVYNYSGSGASGKWQFMPGTWAGYGGYTNAADAPEYIQDAKAREVWAGGSGCHHWDAC